MKNTITLAEYITKIYGEIGTPKRDAFELGYKVFESKVNKSSKYTPSVKLP